MSGMGGGGAMVLYRARENRYRGDRLRHARAATACASRTIRSPARRGLRHLPLAAGEGRPQSARPRLDRGARRRRRHGGGAPPPRQDAVEGAAGAGRQTRRRRTAGGLVDDADDRELRGRSQALSRERRSLSAGRACRRTRPGASRAAMRLPQDRLKATLSHLAARRPARFLPGRSRAQHCRRHQGGRRRALGRGSRRLPRPSARAAGDPYRGGKVVATPELTAGPTLALRRCGCCRRNLAPGGAPGCCRLQRIRRWRCSRPIASGSRTWAMPTAAARSAPKHLAPACTTAFLGGRPPRQHGGGDADPAARPSARNS